MGDLLYSEHGVHGVRGVSCGFRQQPGHGRVVLSASGIWRERNTVPGPTRVRLLSIVREQLHLTHAAASGVRNATQSGH